MAKRKEFICKCGKITSKTAPNYYAQVKRIGYALCTECSLSRNAEATSKRLKEKYTNKNSDIINIPCIICGRDRFIQRRSSNYNKCKSCAGKENRKINKKLYDSLAASRTSDIQFSTSVSNGIMQLPLEKRKELSANAHCIRWSNNIDDRLYNFIEQAKEIHSEKYDYALVEYINYITPVKIICKEHGVFTQTPKGHINGYGCNRCAELNTISNNHKEISDFVESLGFDIINNDRKTIYPYELDINIPSKRIAIEFHGIYWHSYNNIESSKERTIHKNKLEMANKAGYQLIQIFEPEWINKSRIIKNILMSKLHITNKVYARNCQYMLPNNIEYNNFMDENHLQGARDSSYRLGLMYGGSLVCAIGISKHNAYQHELIRFATCGGITVVGGLSKLLSKAYDDISFRRLLTYADRRYSNGNGYLKCGFKFISNTEPNYFYTTGDKNQMLLSRQRFQKHKLSSRLHIFDNKLTEVQNMFNNGFRRIWDAGHMKLILDK